MVVPTAYPLLILAAPALGIRLVQTIGQSTLTGREKRRIMLAVVVLLLSVGTTRLASGLIKGVRSPSVQIKTAAGTVYVRDGGYSKQLIDAVNRNLADGRSMVEIPFGGGMNFCFKLSSPAFSTQFTGFRPDEGILQEDLNRIMNEPPSLVVARNAHHLGAAYGIPGTFGCCFPRLRWVPAVLTLSDREIPAVRWIELNYAPVEYVGDFVLLKPKRELRRSCNPKRLESCPSMTQTIREVAAVSQ